MKKIIIIFIIVFCLLSSMKISCLAKEPFNYGEFWNLFSVNEQSALLLGIYLGILKGMTDGIEHYISCFSPPLKNDLTYYFVVAEMEPEKAAKILAYLITKEPGVLRKREESLFYIMGADIVHKLMKLLESVDPDVIGNVISDLYEDSANAYIPIEEIYILALRKIKGEDMEPLLQEARGKALTFGN
ncbi:hypothetical protein ES708_32000 [subsurface metagenome]